MQNFQVLIDTLYALVACTLESKRYILEGGWMGTGCVHEDEGKTAITAPNVKSEAGVETMKIFGKDEMKSSQVIF